MIDSAQGPSGDFATSDDRAAGRPPDPSPAGQGASRGQRRHPARGGGASRHGVSRLVDVGAGVGAVGLAVLQRLSAASGDLIEKDVDLAALAEGNATLNGLSERARVLRVNITQADARREAGLIDGAADLVVTNPPFFDAGNVRASPDVKRASAHVFEKSPAGSGQPPLEAWIVACLALLRAGGRFLPDPPARRAGANPHRIRATAWRGGDLGPHSSERAGCLAHRLLIVQAVKGGERSDQPAARPDPPRPDRARSRHWPRPFIAARL